MHLIELKDENQINQFVAQQERSQLLQSAHWQKILRAQKQIVQVWAVVDDQDNLLLSSLLVKSASKLFNYYYAPRGPIVSPVLQQDQSKLAEVLDFWIKSLKQVLVGEKIVFLRVEPDFSWPKTLPSLVSSLDIQAKQTLLLDLNKDTTELISDMKQKARYNLRLAEKKGVEIVEGNLKVLDKFWQLLQETKERNQFGIHSQEHYSSLLANSEGVIKLLLAKHDHKIIAGGLFSYFGHQAVYLHGASTSEHRNLMAPYALQWRAINLAKEQGCRWYDFGGISAVRWPGVTRFKLGFGGQVYDYPGTFDLVLKPKLYYWYKLLRRLKRKFL